MKAADVKIGMKVVPANNKLGDQIKLNWTYQTEPVANREYLIVGGYIKLGGYHILDFDHNKWHQCRNPIKCFSEGFEPYESHKQKVDNIGNIDLTKEPSLNGPTIIPDDHEISPEECSSCDGMINYINRVYGEPAKNDTVTNPSHYTSGAIECIDAITEAVNGLEGDEAYLTGNIIKYMWRWKKKGGIEDLKKAQWYLARLIKQQESTS